MIWACNGRDDTPCCAEPSLRRAPNVASRLTCFPDEETLPKRVETHFFEQLQAQRIMFLPPSPAAPSILKTDRQFAMHRWTRCVGTRGELCTTSIDYRNNMMRDDWSRIAQTLVLAQPQNCHLFHRTQRDLLTTEESEP